MLRHRHHLELYSPMWSVPLHYQLYHRYPNQYPNGLAYRHYHYPTDRSTGRCHHPGSGLQPYPIYHHYHHLDRHCQELRHHLYQDLGCQDLNNPEYHRYHYRHWLGRHHCSHPRLVFLFHHRHRPGPYSSHPRCHPYQVDRLPGRRSRR